MAHAALSAAMEDYLKGIFYLSEVGAPVGTNALATRLEVAAPSATNMIKRLAELKLVSHSPYRGIELTAAGRTLAVEIIRHHRLIELYLAEFLDVPWDRVHEEAERLEHVLSEDLETRMAAKLGHPLFDPHGDPIPSDEGAFPELPAATLWDVPESREAQLVRVCDQDPGLLLYLERLHLVPGARIQVMSISPYGGTQTIQVDGQVHVIGCDLAQSLLVSAPAMADSEVPE